MQIRQDQRRTTREMVPVTPESIAAAKRACEAERDLARAAGVTDFEPQIAAARVLN